MSYIKQLRKHGFRAVIEHDVEPTSPRDWDNLGTMICWHPRYTLGDDHDHDSPADLIHELANDVVAGSADVLTERLDRLSNRVPGYGSREWLAALDKLSAAYNGKIHDIAERGYVVLPLYLYDHGGISMSTGSFGCPWDSGQVGYIYCSLADAKREWPDLDGEALRAHVGAALAAEVAEYDQYLRGDVYTVMIQGPDREWIDGCSGFYGLDYAEEQAREMLADAIRSARVARRSLTTKHYPAAVMARA